MTDDPGSRDAVIIERVFDAPVDLVWRLWTEPEHFAAWYGPDGATVPVATMEVRVGGRRQVCMEVPTPDGPMRLWFTGEYREVVANKRLVYTESMSAGPDQPGEPQSAQDGARHGDHATTEVRIDLEEVGGRTRLRLTHVGIPADSPGAAGWEMALDKLGARVSTHRDG